MIFLPKQDNNLKEKIYDRRIEKQKSERLSRKNMDLYVNLEQENNTTDSNMPDIEKRVIKLNSNIPEDEDFGL